MNYKDRRIAVLAPVAWRCPPRGYGAWETVASNLTEGLVERGWDVTLFATKDSVTKAKLHAVVERGYEEDKSVDPRVVSGLHISEAMESAGEFDLIHNHFDWPPLTYSRLIATPLLTTIHGFSSPDIRPIYRKYRENYYVSISNSDRDAELDYVATVYNGIDLSQFTFRAEVGEKLVWLGRIHPDKGVELAIATARKCGRELIIAGIIQDKDYFEQKVEPYVDGRRVRYIGPVGPKERDELFGQAYATLHLNTIPERFGLVLAESMAAGVPVIAMDLGSCREVVADGRTGFLVNSVEEAAEAVGQIERIDRRKCRRHVEGNFTVDKMVDGYERVYAEVFSRQAKKQKL